jgi:signal transduction histidine kinase/DNA-binding response OmpR family regulator
MLGSSISTRVGAYAATVLTVVGLAAVYTVYLPHQRILAENALRRLARASEERNRRIVESIALLREDVQFLAGVPPLAGIGRARAAGGRDPLSGDTEKVWKSRLEAIFLSLLRRRPEYVQVRVIDYAAGGVELVRIDRAGPNLLVAEPQDPQQKVATEYAQGAALLTSDEVWLSEIDFSREYDKSTMPPTPTIHAATPVYGEGETPFAVVVINQSLARLLDDLEEDRPQGAELYLTNSVGGYLLDSASQSAFDPGIPRRLQSDLPILEDFYRSEASDDRGLFDFKRQVQGNSENFAIAMTKVRFDPAHPSRFLALGMYSPYATLLADSSAVGQTSALTASLLVLLGTVLILFYVRRLLRPLALVAASTDCVAAGQSAVALPPESDDEIGSLARSFRSMVHQIKERTFQLERHKLSLLESNSHLDKVRQELEAKTIELKQKAGEDKSELLARISHDIRTPLNSMLLLANALADNPEQNLTSDQERSARVLAGAGADLFALINDLLDLSKLEAGKLRIIFEDVVIAALVRHVSGQFQHLAAAQGLDLRVDLDPALPDILVTDPRRLRQILSNLLSNALKYTDAGSVNLTVRPVDSACIAFRVQDTGDGIPADQLDRIFSPYHRLDRHIRSSRGGTGLGLSIVKELTAALGAELDVGSKLGEGTWFEVRLPCRPPLGSRSEPHEETRTVATQDGTKLVLVADDDTATRWALSRSFHQADPDIVVDEAETGPQALEAIRRHGYQCVVLDYHLPQLDGMSILQALDADPPAIMPQVLLYTGLDLNDDERRTAERLGAIVIPKAGVFGPIVDAVNRTFSGEHPTNIPGRRLLLVEDDPASSFALTQELVRLGANVEQARDGLEAIQILADRQDIDAVLMDMRMVVMDGYEAIGRIRSHAAHRRLPIIAITADVTDVNRDRCLAAGATSFVPKPIDPRTLAREIHLHTAARAAQPQNEASLASPRTARNFAAADE